MRAWVFEQSSAGWVATMGTEERAALLDVVDDVVELLSGGAESADAAGAGDAGPVDAGADHAVDAGALPTLRIGDGPVAAPSDPALRRLLPDGSRSEPDVAAEYRRLTEGDLRATKVGNLARLRVALAAEDEAVVVAPADGPAVAAALTDLRLVVSARLGIRTEADAEAMYRLALEGTPLDMADDDAVARRFLAIVAALLGALLESLVELMLDGLPEDA